MRAIVLYAFIIIGSVSLAAGCAVDLQANERTALRWSVSSPSGGPLDGVYVIEVLTPIKYSVKWLPVIEDATGLPRDTEALRAAVEAEVRSEQEFFDLFQYHRNGYVFPFRLGLSGITENGRLSHGWDLQGRAERARRSGYEVLGSLFVVAKAGFQTRVVYVSDKSLRRAASADRLVTVELTPRADSIPDPRRKYLDRNLALQRDIWHYWEEVRPGMFSSFITPPFSAWQSELKAMKEEASRLGNAEDEVWLLLAMSGCSRFTSGGYDTSGGKSDLAHGPVNTVLEEMAEILPESVVVTAARDQWLFMRDSPIGLREDRVKGSVFPSIPPWPSPMIEELIELGKHYARRPLVALAASDAGVRTRGFREATQEDREKYYAARMRIWSRVQAKYPSSLWFGWYYDVAYLEIMHDEAPYCVRLARKGVSP